MKEIHYDSNLGDLISAASNRKINIEESLRPECICFDLINNLSDYVKNQILSLSNFKFLISELSKEITKKTALERKNITIINHNTLGVDD